MKTTSKIRMIVAACGAVAGLAGSAQAQPYLINISGATLLENFLKAPASTNDYFDANGDGLARIFGDNQQLAPFGLPPGNPGQHWIVQYRAVGSVNGFQELIDFGRTYVTTEDNIEIFSDKASKSFHNRTQFIANGDPSNDIFNAGNPGGAPVRSTIDGAFEATYSLPNSPSDGGIQINISVIDVPARWAVTISGDADADTNPGLPGYGDNDAVTNNKDGTVNGFGHKLANLGDLNLFDPGNPDQADDKTLFDTPIAFAPIAPVVNLGVGMSEIDKSELKFLFSTGRLSSGENLVSVTRDTGSGTHNGFMNSICLDPSFGIGDNIGGLSVASSEQILGPDFIPTNKVGNGEVERTTQNHRLAIGYAGAERGVNSGWLTGGKLEILAVRNDDAGGQNYHRPNIDAILDNGAEGYNIGGPAVLTTIGDPRSASEDKGGDPGNDLPDMANVEAAAYINNITLSAAAFVGDPGGDPTLFTPGELLATQLILPQATDLVQNSTDPCDLIENPDYNDPLQIFTRANNVLKNSVYYSFGSVTLDGPVPTRKTGVVYSDGVANGDFYIDQGGALISYAGGLTARNRIAGDFNGDGQRNLDDAPDMLAAWAQRNGGDTWDAPDGSGPLAGVPGSDAIIEVLGDFNGDGNFDAADIRYWADGLAIDPLTGKLDRAAGFMAIDDAFGGNFFGTTWANGNSYQPGDSRFDVANSDGAVAPGFAPVGADGVIDDADIAYVQANFCNWSDLDSAIGKDLSADVTGDLVVNQADVDAFGGGGGCYADFTGDGALDLFDFLAFVNAFNAQEAKADCVSDGAFDLFDFLCFVNAFNVGC
jgi:hypothetical protein